MTSFPTAWTVSALHAAYRAGLEPAEVVAETYRRIEAADDPGIFISLLPAAETQAAVQRLGPFEPQAKPLWGIPFGVKDNIDVAGLPTTAACPQYAYHPLASAEAVGRLVAAGAIPIGKTNLDQFATGLVGVRTPYPAPRNPFDPEIVPGGSSSGSAVAVARGLVPFALGTDTAGSGRVPAGLNDVVGLKPTKGIVSARGVVPACRSLDCVSVFAANVGDAVTVLRSMAGFDRDDPFSRPTPPFDAEAISPSGLRIGVPDQASRYFGDDEFSAAAFRASLADLAAMAAAVVEVDFTPFLAAGRLVYEGPWLAERYLSVGGFMARHPDAVLPVTLEIISAGARLSAADAFADFHRLAEWRRATEAVWQRVDVLVVPTIPRPVRLAEVAADPIGANGVLGRYTNFVNVLDLSALAVPGRRRGDGFPSGITLIAPAGCDDRIAVVGAALEATVALCAASPEPR